VSIKEERNFYRYRLQIPSLALVTANTCRYCSKAFLQIQSKRLKHSFLALCKQLDFSPAIPHID
jgi:hypothetical protein